MATNGVGLTGSIVHANISPQAAYSYRSGMGMVRSSRMLLFLKVLLFTCLKQFNSLPVSGFSWKYVYVQMMF